MRSGSSRTPATAKMKNRWIGALLTLPVAVLGSETAYRIAQPTRAFPSGNCLVLALGAPSRPDGTASPLQRFRVEAAVATLRQQQCRGLLLTGGAVRNDRIEAVTMACLAESLGVRTDQMVIEPSARNTWENMGCLHSWLRRADRVFVVSDTLHAQRAVRYACRQDSLLCGTVVNAGVVPPINQLWWSLPAAAWQGVAFLRDRIVFERNPEKNAPLCGNVERPEQTS
jgi:vancomycin permeability regulator SanA